MAYKYVGARQPVADALLKATGQTVYTGDLKFPNMLHGKILFSPVAHARIKNIDTSEAEALPGVKAVVSHLNAPKAIFNSALRFMGHDIPATELVFDTTVRYIGDRVAAVAAESPEIAAQAVKLIQVEYEELPAIFDAEEALKPSAYPIHPGGNLVKEIKLETGDVDKALAENSLIFEQRVSTPLVHHLAIEPHATVAHWSKDSKLSVWTTSQNVFATRILLGHIFNLPLSKVHVIKPPLGGGFGGKLEMTIEPVAALLAQQTGRYVRLELNRTESMVSTRTRHATTVSIKTAATKEGYLLAQSVKVIANTGAYATSALNILGAMSGKYFQLYRIPNMRFVGHPVYTNTPIAGAMRGYGSPQLIVALEIHLDKIARALKLDPVDIRLKNLVQPFDLNPLSKKPIGNCRVVDCLEKGAAAFKWADRKKESSSQIKTGFGIGCGVHGNGVFPAHHDITTMTLKLNEDGSATLFTGTHDLGGGSNTIYTQIIAEILGINPSWIQVIEADTEKTSFDLGAYASRNTWVGGSAAKKVAEQMLNQLNQLAVQLLETPLENVQYKEGNFSLKESANQRVTSIQELINYAHKVTQQDLITSITYYSSQGAASYGVHLAKVEVNTITGQVKVVDYVAAHDVGKAINPLLVEGQIEGGIQMGIGYALSEELRVDPSSGKITNAHLKKYPTIKAKHMPPVNIILVEELEEPGPFGAKSVGEIATIPVAAAIVNAINDALGTCITDLPVTPEKILAALNQQGK
jgi:CO/xanthine dehydrogenase Mo-binding subunit